MNMQVQQRKGKGSDTNLPMDPVTKTEDAAVDKVESRILLLWDTFPRDNRTSSSEEVIDKHYTYTESHCEASDIFTMNQSTYTATFLARLSSSFWDGCFGMH